MAATYLLTAWLSNPIRPFEIEVDRKQRLRALTNLAMDLDLPARYASCVAEAAEEAGESQGDGFDWLKVGMIAAGFGIVIAAPALVLIAAPAGLAGGAALVAGLAGLGPGGMLGGLTVVGVVGGLGGSLAVGALTDGSSAEVQDLVVFLQSRAKAIHDLRLGDGSHPEWRLLNAMASSMSSELRRHTRVSDTSSRAVKEAERKAKHLRKALEWLEKNSLAPRALPATTQALAELQARVDSGRRELETTADDDAGRGALL
jgi:hypothetical protein